VIRRKTVQRYKTLIDGDDAVADDDCISSSNSSKLSMKQFSVFLLYRLDIGPTVSHFS